MENVYQAPESDISTVDNDATQPVKLFNAKGRMGRIRYIFYTTFVPFIAYVVMAIVMAIMIPAVADSGSKAFGVIAALLAIGFLIFLLVVLFLATIQRCHDFDTSGWLSLIILLPIIPIIFWFIPGTKGENKYGYKTPKNNIFHIIMIVIIPVLIGILAAIAIPAYQDYVERAKSAQISQQG